MKKQKEKKIRVGFGVMILKDRKILLGKRNDDAKKADSELHGEGTWTMPGGKLEFNETFEDGAKREVLEETSILIKNAKVICVNNDKNKHAHFVTIGLLSTEFEGTPKVMEPDEITEWKWFASDELPMNIFLPSKKFLENFKAKKFYIK
jgi:8-oxo-dGTP diphosphatase